MNSRQRLLTAAAFREPDRVPVELAIDHKARELPETQRIVEFIDTPADNFLDAPGADWGFFGLSSEYRQEIIEDVPDEYRRIRRTHSTSVGDFHAITRHIYPHVDSADFRWERRYIDSLEEMERLADAPRTVRPILAEQHRQAVQQVLDEGQAQGVDSTPTIIVNGINLGYPRSFEDVQRVIEEELAKASQ